MIFVNACIREEDSRTLRIAKDILKNENIEEIDLNKMNLLPYTYSNNPVMHGIKDEFIDLSKKIANSDGLIIAAPFWDMSFPALLKVFLEKLSIVDVMFKDTGETCLGIAKCPFMFLITTRGMNIDDESPLEQATPYLKALCELWGIKKFDSISAYNLDYSSSSIVEEKIKNAIKEGKEKLDNLKK